MTNLTALHNVRVVQSRKGWTKADALKALADARNGIVYAPDHFAKVQQAHRDAIEALRHA